MKLALYVHDLKLEIGHSNSLIELVRHLPEEFSASIDEIEVVTFTTTPLTTLFPNFKGKLTWKKVPLANLKPVLLKSVFYQAWTFLYNRLFQGQGFTRIGIGISSLDVDAVSVQFIHRQWTERGLKMERGHFLRRLYKHVLFRYFELCEDFLFSRKGLKVFSPARFLTEFLKGTYPSLDGVTIYSGVNLSRFELPRTSKGEVLAALLPNYPALKDLDLAKPIYLFVGAYERKGLFEALDHLTKKGEEAQFIVIGSPSLGRPVTWPSQLKVFPISFTREVPKFYALADVFLFPTIYEPFGLVIFEAMAMGLTLVTRRHEVGASELLEDLPEVYFTDRQGFRLPEPRQLSIEEKLKLREERLARLGDVSWTKAGAELARFLS